MSKCGICGLSGNLPCGCTETEDSMVNEKQKVWRTMSELPNGSGYIIWDIREVMGETDPSYLGVENTLDGGQIYVSIYHTFTLPRAMDLVFDPELAEYGNLFIVHTMVNGMDWHGPRS